MRKGLAIGIAYVATAAAVPWLFALAQIPFRVPLERAFFVLSPFELFALFSLLAGLSGLPGFLLFRLVFRWLRIRSVLAFAMGGAVTGVSAAALLCLPGSLWVFRSYPLAESSASVGFVAGLIQVAIERAMLRWLPALPLMVQPR